MIILTKVRSIRFSSIFKTIFSSVSIITLTPFSFIIYEEYIKDLFNISLKRHFENKGFTDLENSRTLFIVEFIFLTAEIILEIISACSSFLISLRKIDAKRSIEPSGFLIS
jgi:hypothetical protein